LLGRPAARGVNPIDGRIALIDLDRTRSQSDGSISVRTRANILSPNVSKSHGVAIVLEELLRK